MHIQNQFCKDTFNAYQKIKDILEINDWNEYACQLLFCNKILELMSKQLFFFKSLYMYEKVLTQIIIFQMKIARFYQS